MGKNSNTNIGAFIEPKYFRGFSCIGADCPENCCFGWGRINFTPKEVEKIKNADCSAELKELINKTFVPTHETNVSGGTDRMKIIRSNLPKTAIVLFRMKMVYAGCRLNLA